jgi:ethanolamine utilization protein EutN
MRIGKVVGKLSLSRQHSSLDGRRWVLAVPHDLRALAGPGTAGAEEIVVVDELGAMPGDRIGICEGMEATFPYHPEPKPVDAYNACILDDLHLDASETQRLLKP